MQVPYQVITEGSAVPSAIQEALDMLRAREQEVEIVVEQQPRKGFFGLGRRNARVRVRRVEQKSPEGDLEAIVDELVSGESAGKDARMQDGMLTIQAGQIRVTAPVGKGRHPVIRPGNHTRVWINNRLVDRLSVVTPDDAIRVETVDKPPQTDVQAEISADKFTAYISVFIRPGIRYRLADQTAADDVTVTAVREAEIPPYIPTIDDLKTALTEKGIVYGVSTDALEQVIHQIETAPENLNNPMPIAFGVPVEPTVDEQAELLFDPVPRSRTEIGEGQVDLLGLYRLSTVQPGELLAIIHPGRQGRPGRTVTGQVVPVTEPRPAKLKAGDGVAWHVDQQRLLATRGGRPSLVRDTVSTHPKHTEFGDIDAQTGHIDFDGDVEVMGHVSDSMKVVAGGSIFVQDSVSNARVEAEEGVVIGRSITKSTVIAGSQGSRLIELLAVLRPLTHDLGPLVKAVQQVKTHPRLRAPAARQLTDGRLIKLLLEKKFTDVEGRVRELVHLTHSRRADWLDNEFVEFATTLHRRMVGFGPISMNDLTELVELQAKCQAYTEAFSETQEHGLTFDVATRHIHNADVWASGQIIFHHGGCYYSRLYAGHGVTMDSGVFRGDSITVNSGNVTLDEVGSPLGAEVRIDILADGQFRARKIYPGVVVTIDNQTHKFDTQAQNVRIQLAKGKLQVSGVS